MRFDGLFRCGSSFCEQSTLSRVSHSRWIARCLRRASRTFRKGSHPVKLHPVGNCISAVVCRTPVCEKIFVTVTHADTLGCAARDAKCAWTPCLPHEHIPPVDSCPLPVDLHCQQRRPLPLRLATYLHTPSQTVKDRW
jgi:hypothetical protein